MRVVVTGSRAWRDRDLIRRFLETLPRDTIVHHGGARGADRIAGELAKELFSCEPVVYPYVGELGKMGGHARNTVMLGAAAPDLVAGFPVFGPSGGTHNCLEKATFLCLPVVITWPDGQVAYRWSGARTAGTRA